MPGLEERVAALEAAMAQFAQPEPEFMARTTVEPLNSEGLTGTADHLTIRLVHQPTGIEVVARDRAEAIVKLRKALTDRARRESGLQEAERRAQRRAAEGTPGAP